MRTALAMRVLTLTFFFLTKFTNFSSGTAKSLAPILLLRLRVLGKMHIKTHDLRKESKAHTLKLLKLNGQ